MNSKIKVAIIGVGARGMHYARCCQEFSDQVEVTAIADLIPERLRELSEELHLPENRCFASGEELLEQDRLADIMFICTQDRQHFIPAVRAMEKGYHLLLEKPVSPFAGEWGVLLQTAERTGRQVVVCHVLRYTPFYQKIKEIIDSGQIGEIVSIQAMESVLWWHQAHSYVRGNWNNSDTSSPMILAKCCHDLDLLLWLSGKKCIRAASIGSLKHFRRENAPAGSADRCIDCGVKENCPYDAEKIYICNDRTGVAKGNTQWPCDVLTEKPTVESIQEAISSGPYGRCVYRCDNNVVDHQIVMLEMEDQVTADLNMCAFTAGSRSMDVMGTLGEIKGNMDQNYIKVTPFGLKPVRYYEKDLLGGVPMEYDPYGHGGGDKRLIQDLIHLIGGKGKTSTSLTSLQRSLESHYVSLAAEESRIHGGMPVDMERFIAENSQIQANDMTQRESSDMVREMIQGE
ncbi:Gfo/Idh/MocA family oxidoreductase [Diplocloster hominis]|uniref:Gfo/Idh/MocA family protein n=1 Tax=Diplocloster hominis TaxID=3079010 RepID=UPI0031BACFC0